MVAVQHGTGAVCGQSDALSVGLWWAKVAAETNECYLPLMLDENRYLVLMGGGGSGKSIFAGRKIIERCVTEPGHLVIAMRKVATSLRPSVYKQLVDQVSAIYPEQVAKIPRGESSDMYILFRNGSKILFFGLDDVEKMKSIKGVTMVWLEEATEMEERDFSQMDIRLRDACPYYKQIILTFNPVSVTHWLKARFFDRHDKRATTSRTTYHDNRFLEQEQIETLESFRVSDPYYYEVYCLGMWGVLSATIFAKQKIVDRLRQLPKPVRQGRMRYEYDGGRVTKWMLEDNNDEPEILIWKEPEPGRPYVMGADTAGEGSDWFVADVIDNVTGEQVARYRVRTDEDIFARTIYGLGMWYNRALIGVEANFSTHPNKELLRLGYPNLYLREAEDKTSHKTKHSIGVRTDRLTRPVIIGGLVEIVRDHVDLINDEVTLNEMLAFGRNEKGRPEAAPGAHDDCVMALGITYYIREQQGTTVRSASGKRATWRKDQYEDYYNATSETERQELLRLWGNPF